MECAFDACILRRFSHSLLLVVRGSVLLSVRSRVTCRRRRTVRIIELARRGECDPERLRDRVLREADATPAVVDAADRRSSIGFGYLGFNFDRL